MVSQLPRRTPLGRMTRPKSQIAAERRYDAKRRARQVQVLLRLNAEQAQWLDEQRQQPGESRPAALRRLSGMPD